MIITKSTKDIATLDFVNGQVILINKDLDWTSFDVVNKLRYTLTKRFNLKKLKVGHGGTLDPLATGLMLVCTGKETKNQETYQAEQKGYLAELTLGGTTPSFDLETETNATFSYEHITKGLFEQVLGQLFSGTIEQVPPIYSAKHIDGKRAYKTARAGEEVIMKSQQITIYNIKIVDFVLPKVSISVVCSKGTYIRSLANDIGKALNSGAYLSKLQRTSIGTEYKNEDALTIAEFEQKLAYIQ